MIGKLRHPSSPLETTMQTTPTGTGHPTAVGDLPALRASFLRHLRATNLAPNTVRTYEDAVEQLTKFIDSRGDARLGERGEA
jgi:hypothetical protein